MSSRAPGSARPLFALYAAASLVPVLVLGVVLLTLLSAQGNDRGLREGQSQAELIGGTAIAPLLDGNDLRTTLSPAERGALLRSVGLALRDGQILRLRLRDLDGGVVFSTDPSTDGPDEDAVAAAAGRTVAHLTHLDADQGGRGPKVVEVYEPLEAAQTGSRIGVLELYLPYAPIKADISRGRRVVTVALTTGLLALWLVLLAISMSVTGRLRRQVSLNARLAREDILTGRPNRAQFMERLADAAGHATADRPAAVAVLNIDRFKQINDTLGHGKGDKLLILLAERLHRHVGPSDTVARLGADEFGIVIADRAGVDDARQLFAELRKVVAEPLHIDGLPLAVEASVGFALTPRDGTDAGALAQHADIAMYVAKEQHLGVVGYHAEQDQQNAPALGLVAELGAAIAADQLVLHYQPKIDLATGAVTSVEALVRWQHPVRGLLYPDGFLPAVEQTELIEPLTWWVLRTATLALARLDPGGADCIGPTMGVAVNISARSLTRPEFADDVLAVVTGTGTDPHRVILEVTETVLLADPPRAAATLARLSRAGFRISIDDFGAGQTSLGYLATLPITELKIDKSFVLAMMDDRRSAAIVGSIIDLGHRLGFTVTAEGIETDDVFDHLRGLDCDTGQGFLMARPMPLADLLRRLSVPAGMAAHHLRPGPDRADGGGS